MLLEVPQPTLTRRRDDGAVATPSPAPTSVSDCLDVVARALRDLWVAALEDHDSEEAARLVEASHAVRRASLALTPGSLIDHPSSL